MVGRGSEGGADGKFALACDGPSEQERGNVSARDEEEQQSGGKEEFQRLAVGAGLLLGHGQESDAAAFVFVGILLGQAGGNGIHFGLSLCERNPRLEATDDAEIVGRAVEPVAIGSIKYPNGGLGGKFKAGRRNGGDAVETVIEFDRLADGRGGSAKFGLPEGVRNDRRLRVIFSVLSGFRQLPGNGHEAKDGEELFRDEIDGLELGAVSDGERHFPAPEAGESGEGVGLVVPVLIVGAGDILAKPKALRAVERAHDPVAIGIRQGLQEEGIEDREDASVGTNAQAENDHRKQDKAGSTTQLPKGLSQHSLE